MKNLVTFALDAARSLGADYADVRFRSTKIENIYTFNDVLKNLSSSDEVGIGIRVMVKGRWGFAATPYLTNEKITETVKKAIEIAKSTAVISQNPMKQTPDKAQTGIFRSNVKKDPFTVPLDQKLNLLFTIAERARKQKEVKRVDGNLYFKKMHQYFMSTEGADLENEVNLTSGTYTVTAVGNNTFQTRMMQEYPKSHGYEWIEAQPFVENAEKIAEDAVRKLYAKQGPIGKRDLVLLPSHLVLTIHESVGHPTELDRVLGWEANYAGTSFATPEKRGKLQYASPIVNFVADNTLEGGLATWGWDDDGIPGKKWHIIKDGILANYGTTRETAHIIGDTESMGCNRADSYASQPINRIPNLSLMAGKNNMTLDEMIADVKDGVLIEGRGSFSIDQNRNNFQFGGDMFHEIKNGKITEPLRDVIYQAITTDFWNSCDAVCDQRFWEPYGVLNCGKGEPGQVAQMTHGSAPARFRNISLGGAFNG